MRKFQITDLTHKLCAILLFRFNASWIEKFFEIAHSTYYLGNFDKDNPVLHIVLFNLHSICADMFLTFFMRRMLILDTHNSKQSKKKTIKIVMAAHCQLRLSSFCQLRVVKKGHKVATIQHSIGKTTRYYILKKQGWTMGFSTDGLDFCFEMKNSTHL